MAQQLIRVVNLEQGMPTVEFARKNLAQAIRNARSCGYKILKVIHGYGSSGRGGAIKRDVARELLRMQQEKGIAGFVCGEDFSPFDATARRMIDLAPELRHDRDYSRQNHGVTFILL